MLLLSNRVKHDFLETCARISSGSLRLHTPEGETFDFGLGSPTAEMQINDWSIVTAIAARGDVGLGETYVTGLWDTPSVQDLATVALMNLDHFQGYTYAGFWNRLKFRVVDRLMRANSPRGASRNIRAHYDVGNEFYQLWLDEGMTYSSAMFSEGDSDLGRGQNRKYDRILGRLGKGERVLEIGCGWGGFAERAADTGRHVTGLTISPSQKGYDDARLDGRAEIRLQDYRKRDGHYDSIVSIEMIEAVGHEYLGDYFAWQQLLASPDGVRKRLALALSEYFVISVTGVGAHWRSQMVAHYWDLLVSRVSGNFRVLLEEVSMNIAMGFYLNTKGNQKEDSSGRQPDENYAREVMQLFTIGLYQLNLDGTPRRDSAGKPLETYTQSDITHLARVFTGYNTDYRQDVNQINPFDMDNGTQISTLNNTRLPMRFNSFAHSNLAVSFLGTTIAANTPGPTALGIALDTLFNHPNVGPFPCRRVLQSRPPLSGSVASTLLLVSLPPKRKMQTSAL